MTQDEDFLGGLNFDGTARDVQVSPATGIIRYYPVTPGQSATAARSVWWHVLAAAGGLAGAALAAFVWGFGLAGMIGAGVIAGAVVAGGRFACLTAGLGCLAVVVVPRWTPEFADGPAVLLISMFLLLACWRPSS